MAVGFPSKVDFATGDVLSATNVNDISGTLNLVNGTQYSGGKNRVLNSAFQVWQRGTSIAYAGGNQYTADRWCFGSGATGRTISRQATGDTTNLPNIQYCARVQRDSGNTSTAALKLNQSFESANSIPLAGKAVVVSFYARAGANFSAASSLLTGVLYSGTGTDQNVDVTYTGQATVATASATLTTSWQRFTATGTVASTATEVALLFSYTPVGTAGTNDYFEVTGVQLEASTVASAYAPNGATYQAELAACQRYYYRLTPGATYNVFGSGFSNSTTVFLATIPTPVTMRIAPTALEQSGTASQYSVFQGSSGLTCSAVPALYHGNTNQQVVSLTVASGLTIGQAGIARTDNNTTAYLGWTAEL